MKFYYNGKLVRTSKTHEYHFAVANADGSKVISCHGTYEAAQKEINRMLAEARQAIENCMNAITAIDNNRSGYYGKFGRTERFIKFTSEMNRAYYEEALAEREELLEWYKQNRKIVELQAIA